MTIDEMIEVLKAAKEGKAIQYKKRFTMSEPWRHASEENHLFNFDKYDYRIMTVPKVAWLNEYHEGSPEAFLSYDEAFEARDSTCSRVAVRYVEAQ